MKETLVCFSVVCLSSCLIMAADRFTVNCTKTVIMGKYGSSVVLPCWLKPETNAESMEIRWYRPGHFQTPILLYQNHKITTDLYAAYSNRGSFTTTHAQSTGLKQGDVSLRLDNLGLSDIGTFQCYVEGEKTYDDSSVTLNLTALGSLPHLSLEIHQDSLNLSCSSCGWYPHPRLRWESTTKKDAISPIYSVQDNGLLCIRNWIILSSSVPNKISCSVNLSEDEKRNVSMALGAVPVNNCGLWKIILALVLLCLLALIVFFLYRKYKTEYQKVSTDEPGDGHSTKMEALRKYAVKITFDKEHCNQNHLQFSPLGDMVRDKGVDSEYTGLFQYSLCVCGKETFSSGCAYWEVGLIQANVSPKKSWLIGVAKAPYTISEKSSDYTVVNGFYFLFSDPIHGVRLNTIPEISLQLSTTLERIGVLLDFEKKELSFYNATDGTCLTTFKTTAFQGDFVPLFNPGLGDDAPLSIINPEAQTQNNAGSSANAQAGDENQCV